MPIYEYRCLNCDHEFERMQKFSDPPLETCPNCEGTVQKLISRSTFHLKGDGWYVTDYARKSGNNGKSETTGASETSSASSSSDNSKSDSSGSSSKSTETSSSSSSSSTASPSAASST
jgi:putative FmdB family regulatory protein